MVIFLYVYIYTMYTCIYPKQGRSATEATCTNLCLGPLYTHTCTVHLHIDCVCNMQEITRASDSINGALADRKMEIVKLCGVHHLLKKVSCYNALHWV